MDHNPFLKKSAPGGRGSLEKPANIEWQTRAAAPTPFEDRLGDALEKVFAAGAESLPQVVAGLNAAGSRDADDRPWTEDSFEELMKRLGA